ncbi:endonuclease [Cyclobacterium qasimii]|uniref:Endonuclease n=2 Tax=Cyclobacterium qasimii TaxID=1350429 RepID=S7V5P0_9BACT|nr:endonuclease [Cyclobacterium qasimii]EPR65485.1 endonuclease [Cyclobacterium qasimii M12-11B]
MMSFSFSGDLKETWQFDRHRKDLFQKNYQTTQTFLEKLGSPTGASNDSSHLQSQRFVWSLKNNSQEIIRFLLEYQSTQKSFSTRLLADYIKLQANAKYPKLTDWTVAIIENTKSRDENRVQYFNEETIGLSFRRDSSEPGSGTYDLVKAHIIGNFHEYIDLSDEQLEKALNETAEDRKKTGGNPDIVIHPNPLRIRTNRPETNGLLLIYLLNPVPNDRDEGYSDVPIVGLALSFPHIEHETKVIYAVNEVFQKELFDYPEELDNDEFADEEDESKAPSMVRNTMTRETFGDLLKEEASRNTMLNESELSGGVVPNYWNNPVINPVELRNLQNLIIPSEHAPSGPNMKPYYGADEIRQFYLNPESNNRIVNPGTQFLDIKASVVGLKESKYVMFSYSDGEAVFSDSCWVIRPSSLNAKYLTAVYNSTLFGAWVRVSGKQKKDTYYIEREVLENFPLISPELEDVQLFENLYDLLVAAARTEEKQGTGTMKSYYSNILDALVFCCYFGKSLESQMEILRHELHKLIPEQLPEGETLNRLAEENFGKLYHKKHPVREVLFYLSNQSKVSRIKAVFTS